MSATRSADEKWTVRRVLEWTTDHLARHGSESPRLDTEILLAHARGCPRIALYTHYDDPLTDAQRATMRKLVQRRAGHEPVAYLVGHREFFGLDFRVTPSVLIPRPDTETLVMELLERSRTAGGTRIVDLCTGSGCIAVAAAANLPQASIVATDVDAEALTLAAENATAHAVDERIEFRLGDLFEAVADGEEFDVIASNPPYVTSDELETIQPDVRLHEPRAALDGGPDGLEVIRRLIEQAPRHLARGGSLLIEIDPRQADAVRELLASVADFDAISFVNDLTGRPRVAAATKTP